jgi:hypothetical protein
MSLDIEIRKQILPPIEPTTNKLAMAYIRIIIFHRYQYTDCHEQSVHSYEQHSNGLTSFLKQCQSASCSLH